MKSKSYFILISCFVINYALCFSQTKAELEKSKDKTLKEIQYTSNLLKEVRNNKSNSISKLNVINKGVDLRKRLIEDIGSDVNLLGNELDNQYKKIDYLKQSLDEIRMEYIKLIVQTQIQRKKTRNILIYIIAAEDFNMAFKRLQYIQQISDYRRKQAEHISSIKKQIEQESNKTRAIINEKRQLISEKESEKIKLEIEKQKQKEIVGSLKQKEQELTKKINDNRRIADQLSKTIQKYIESEAKKSAKSSLYSQLTPTEKSLSDNFGKNSGMLPWPTKSGIITSSFGKQEHPVLKGIFINNNGIDITAIKGSVVRCVFAGKVSKIIAIKGANYTLIIRHGSYLSVYQNLINVKVNVGDDVITKQDIGEVYYDQDEEASVLHFEIWNELNKLNPRDWLTKSN